METHAMNSIAQTNQSEKYLSEKCNIFSSVTMSAAFFAPIQEGRAHGVSFAERLQERTMLDEQEVQEQMKDFLAELSSLLSQKLRKCA